jgi:hypothetical protein
MKKVPMKTHTSDCAYRYGHDCNCSMTLTHDNRCGYPYGHDCDCGLNDLNRKSDRNDRAVSKK